MRILRVARFAARFSDFTVAPETLELMSTMVHNGEVDHLVAEIAGKESDALYTGYTSCPLITRLGQAMLVEFDYENNLVPSFPGMIAPLEELWISWVMKTMALKPTYISMLRGRA